MITKSFFFISILFIFSFGIQESFAAPNEPVTVITNIETNTLRQQSSPNITSNLEIVDINPAAINDETMNITIFDEVLQVTHEKTITRTENDFTYIGSTNDSYYNVWIAYYEGDMRIEIDFKNNKKID